MSRLAAALAFAALAAALGAAPAPAASPSQGDFGLYGFDVDIRPPAGEAQVGAGQAGSHPLSLTTSLGANFDAEGHPEGRLRDLVIEQVPGLLGDTTAYERCPTLQFLIGGATPACPPESAVGITANSVTSAGRWLVSSVYNLSPPPGVLLRLGFAVEEARVVVDVGLNPHPPHNPVVTASNISQSLDFFANVTQLWGDPSDPAHDELRGSCGADLNPPSLPPEDLGFVFEGGGDSCPVEPRPPFLTLPTYCGAPLLSSYEATSWEGKVFDGAGSLIDDGFDSGSALTHDAVGAPAPFAGCEALPAFDPQIGAVPTSRAADSPSGLDVSLGIEDEGLTSAAGRAKSAIRKAVVALPEGMTANPSLAEGLEVCSEADLGREALGSPPGAGCPQASKVGTVEVDSPLVSETVFGSLYVAEPFANLADDALIALYVVLKNPRLGIIVKQPVKVDPDPRTGQLIATTAEIPQLVFSEVRLRLREGARSPLITPPGCGTHAVRAELTPWSGQPPAVDVASFEIISGPGNGPCPPPGAQPFEPGFAAGSLNNSAARFSPFLMRLTRRDGDQDLTRFDATLPQGVVAKLAGVGRCTDAQIAAAKAKTGRRELASPSCPVTAQIGTVQGGAGVGSQLTYVPGRLYLAGPVGGAPLSVVGIVPAVAGPFDVGTVVVRQALALDPVSGEAKVDGAASDPIPHILAGIPLRVRDIQVNVDRPGFTLNPTSCAEMATAADIWGGGLDVFSPHDDAPVARSVRFQAADCARLGFRPRLGLKLRGGTRRGAHPALQAVYRPRPGQANVRRLALALPRSEFIDQSHFRTICTRVQFAADRCPRGSIYGRVVAHSPLLDEPLRGPVYLRSSNNNLPDAVFDLHGIVDVEVAIRIDSVRGRLRASVQRAPDVPVSKVVVRMQGGRKGLFVNSRNICRGRNRARANLAAHNGRRARLRPPVRPQCKKKRRKTRRSSHRRAR